MLYKTILDNHMFRNVHFWQHTYTTIKQTRRIYIDVIIYGK